MYVILNSIVNAVDNKHSNTINNFWCYFKNLNNFGQAAGNFYKNKTNVGSTNNSIIHYTCYYICPNCDNKL